MFKHIATSDELAERIAFRLKALHPSETDGVDLPMYSYVTPAYIFWEGVIAGMLKTGLSEKYVIDWLQSVETRHALDGEIGDLLASFGTTIGIKIANDLVETQR